MGRRGREEGSARDVARTCVRLRFLGELEGADVRWFLEVDRNGVLRNMKGRQKLGSIYIYMHVVFFMVGMLQCSIKEMCVFLYAGLGTVYFL